MMVALLEGTARGSAAGALVGAAFGQSIVRCTGMTYPESEEFMITSTALSGFMGGSLGALIGTEVIEQAKVRHGQRK